MLQRKMDVSRRLDIHHSKLGWVIGESGDKTRSTVRNDAKGEIHYPLHHVMMGSARVSVIMVTKKHGNVRVSF
jgi:hypothetical protein